LIHALPFSISASFASTESCPAWESVALIYICSAILASFDGIGIAEQRTAIAEILSLFATLTGYPSILSGMKTTIDNY